MLRLTVRHDRSSMSSVCVAKPDRGMEVPDYVEPWGLDSIVLKDCPKILPAPSCSSEPIPQFSQDTYVGGPTFFRVAAKTVLISKERWEGLGEIPAASPKKDSMVIPAAKGNERRQHDRILHVHIVTVVVLAHMSLVRISGSCCCRTAPRCLSRSFRPSRSILLTLHLTGYQPPPGASSAMMTARNL